MHYTSAVEDNLTRAQFDALEPYKITFNNLTIMGSTVTPTGDMTDEEQQTVVYQNSGSHEGILGLSDYDANNVNIGFCVIAVFVCAKGADVNLVDCHLKRKLGKQHLRKRGFICISTKLFDRKCWRRCCMA